MVTMNETPLGPDPREERKPERDHGDTQYDRMRAEKDQAEEEAVLRGLNYVFALRSRGIDLSPQEYETYIRQMRPAVSERVIQRVMRAITL